MLPKLRATLVILFLAAFTPACSARDATVEHRIALRAGMGAVADGRAPRLHEVTPDEAWDGVTIAADEPHHWLGPFREAGTPFVVNVAVAKPQAVDEMLLTVWDWENRPVAQVSLGVGREQNAVRFDVKGRGVYLLTLDGFSGDEQAFRLVRSFAVCESAADAQQAWRDDEFFIGICAFPGRYHWSPGGKPAIPEGLTEQRARDLEASLMGRLGFQLARLDVSMVLPQDEKRAIDWSRMDAAVNAYTARGFKLDLQLMNPPDWAIDPKYAAVKEHRWRYPVVESAYRRYVRELLGRYGEHARFVQVFNEPDQPEFWAGEPGEFIRMFEWARDEIRNTRPGATIVNGGFAFIDPKKTAYYVEQLKGKTDWIAYHSHGNLAELKRDFEHAKRLHDAAGYENPVYTNTETGFTAWRLDQEMRQAQANIQKLLYCRASGQRGVMLFASRMTGEPSRVGRDFGLLDYHFCPRFAYGAVAAFMNTFAGARFDKTLHDEGDVYVYQFKRGGRTLITAFTPGRRKTFTLATDAKAASLIDAMGNPAKADDPGRIPFTAGAYPLTIVLDGAEHIRLVEGDGE